MCSIFHTRPGRKVLGFINWTRRVLGADMRSYAGDRSVRKRLRDPGSLLAKCSIPKGNAMAFKPNYGLQRADRKRAAQARSEEKQKKREEQSAQRKAEHTVEIKSSPDDAKIE